MTVENEITSPAAVTEAAAMAVELHGKLFPKTEEPIIPEAAVEPVTEPVIEPVVEPVIEPVDDQRYKTLQSKYDKEVPRLAAEIRELKEKLKAKAEPEVPVETEYDTIVAKLREQYPDDLVDNLLALNKLQGQQVSQEAVKPLAEKLAAAEATQEEVDKEQYASYLESKAPNFKEIWQVACELLDGEEPSNPAIAAFLDSPDPSGLYTNLQLLDAYNDKWDADRFATLCNMFGEQKPTRPSPADISRIAPTRVRTNTVPAVDGAKKIWSMSEISGFQRDKLAGKYSPEQATEIWADIHAAMNENRIRN
jgi:hypothetical protein